MIRALFFDFDGVLADTESFHLQAFQAVLSPEGYELSEKDYFSKYIGFDDKGAFQAFFKNKKAPKKLQAAASITNLIKKKTAAFQELLAKKDPLFKPVKEIIPTLSRNWPLAIVSGALRHEIEMILKPHGLLTYFEFIVAAEDCVESKPSPEPYLQAFKKINGQGAEALKAEEILVIEDSKAGILSGKKAGMKTLGMVSAYTTRDDLADANWTMASLLDLHPDWLRGR